VAKDYAAQGSDDEADREESEGLQGSDQWVGTREEELRED
jgi:hypothetical protein